MNRVLRIAGKDKYFKSQPAHANATTDYPKDRYDFDLNFTRDKLRLIRHITSSGLTEVAVNVVLIF